MSGGLGSIGAKELVDDGTGKLILKDLNIPNIKSNNALSLDNINQSVDNAYNSSILKNNILGNVNDNNMSHSDGFKSINGVTQYVPSYEGSISSSLNNNNNNSNNGIQWTGEGGAVDLGIQGLGIVNAIGNTVLGFQNYGLAKDTFDYNKKMKNKEYAMALDAYNRQKARGESQSNQARTYGQISTPAVKSDTVLKA